MDKYIYRVYLPVCLTHIECEHQIHISHIFHTPLYQLCSLSLQPPSRIYIYSNIILHTTKDREWDVYLQYMTAANTKI